MHTTSAPITCIMVDDELPALDLMELIIQRRDLPLHVLGKYSLAEEAREAIETLKPELVFLDIVMPDLSGIELVRHSTFKDYAVVFTTAHPQYGVDAARLNSFDYLLKPIVENDLVDVVRRFLERKERNELLTARRLMEMWREERSMRSRRTAFPITGGTTFEDLATIEYFESDGNLTRIFFEDRTRKYVNCNLKAVVEAVDSPQFIRTHKSFLVNMDHIRSLSRKDGGFLEMRNGAQIPISRNNREKILTDIHAYLGIA